MIFVAMQNNWGRRKGGGFEWAMGLAPSFQGSLFPSAMPALWAAGAAQTAFPRWRAWERERLGVS